MDLDNLTPEESQAILDEGARLAKAAREIVDLYKPLDMDTMKILERTTIFSALVPTTRTSILAAAVYAGIKGPLCGLSKDEVIGIVTAVFDLTVAGSLTQTIADKYTKSNVEAQIKAFTGSDVVTIN